MARILSITQKRTLATVNLDPLRRIRIQLLRRDPWLHKGNQIFQHLCGDCSRRAHELQIAFGFQDDHLLQLPIRFSSHAESSYADQTGFKTAAGETSLNSSAD